MLVYLVTGGLLLVYLVLVWFLGTWMHPPGAGIWVLRGGLWLIGLIAAGSFLWFYRKSKAEEAGGENAPAKGSDDLDVLVHEAVRRLKSSTLGRGASLGNLPLVFLLGDSGSTKTTTIIHSALDPELLAGQVYQDNNIVATRVANIWYTRQAIFVDPAGGLLAESGRWRRLVKLVQPGRFSNAMGKGQQAPRAAIVCYDCENFMKPGASETTLSAARKLAVRLQEVSQLLGISFPVYVLFTKLDRISFFPEFARGLSKEEASEVLGATLPVRLVATGVYAEEETRRLAKAFDELFYSLAERRLDLLARENEGDKLPGIYEFPRELRKLRTLLVQFLVDLARPSQLRVNPFLRGFYFSGVRPVIIDDVAAAVAAPEVQVEESGSGAGATRIFSGAGRGAAPVSVAARVAGSRKVPQWVFLSQFFNDVIVKDRVALAASGFSSRVNLLRRVALTSVVLIGIVCAVGFLVSFLGNHALENNVSTAINELRAVQVPSNHIPSLNDLQKLERLRLQLANLSDYQNNGTPWSLRWGLYIGDQIYPDVRNAYFQHFQKLLFADTQARLLAGLRNVPDKPGTSNDSRDNTYSELKAYLITTSNNDKSTKEFLSPVLTSHWTAGREKELDDRIPLARAQLDFYSKELTAANPFSANNDQFAISRARNYLSLFGSADRVYSILIDGASVKNSGAAFSETFSDAGGVVFGGPQVRGAFTPRGFAFMKEAILNPSAYASGEDWVLGKSAAFDLDQASLQQKLTQRYHDDFVNEWHLVLERSSVVAYKDLNDAEGKLGRLAGPTSPLLELFWFISHNTNVGVPSVTDPFSPVHAMEPPGPADKFPDQYVLPNNKDYVLALSKLQSDVGALAKSSSDPVLLKQASDSATAAKDAVTKIIVGIPIDSKFHDENLVDKLLRQPIINVEVLIAGGDTAGVNGAAGPLCTQFLQLSAKYPFNPNSSQDLPVEQLNSILAPKIGSFWTFYDKNLAKYLIKQGSRYVEAPDAKVKLLPGFVAFFNRAAAFSDELYPGGAATPKFAYSLKALPSNVDTILKIGPETLSGIGQQKTFTWTGEPGDVQVTTKGGDILGSFPGPWAVFKFVADAHSQVSGPITTLEWIMQSNGRTIMLPNGKIKSFSYELQVTGFNPFRSSDLSGLRCQTPVAR
jgi:type VI secretion system protein ImpL